MATLDDLKKILRQRGGFEAVEAKLLETQIRLEGRVPPNANAHFLLVTHHLLLAARTALWTCDYSKHFFLKDLPSGTKQFYAHRLIFQAPDIASAIEGIIQTVVHTPQPSRVELQEFPLAGSGAHRTATAGRGAYGVDKAPLGPSSVQQGVRR